MKQQQGFSLIEVLVALGIASVALMALMGRLGVSSDTQLTLGHHAVALDVARNVLELERANPQPPADELSQDEDVGGQLYHWRATTEKTELGLFIRRNVSVSTASEPEVTLFYYREVPVP
ncbi:MAG: type II secretion system protein GspI [Zetaproteobacteria bacterium CG_4_9_14_3_um_filter_49_83]|nr:MAG: type II secretion system protein GspI [Zetaproteobacteria bacterium CG1_02_49_23]PIQ30689.1 MAG: type II secretion system protein GspI [Zetaproteobacteria bacterium CG17_big_fil_post_rev_8_21_14_2_50_50_13]PIV29170.1 MAG: type II secretion system protein GspI [Zetaproteobacteria bacterium CG02_land_8_20_14_3_00_50_9]PIY57180.1 MAG: type II secretion system protein GspI [Zetaproteobacteria bacterium CG_4_10_14_0_8_um_filter_49_80]PJA34455.1 MAG: type II secretion system protein GspI [Zet